MLKILHQKQTYNIIEYVYNKISTRIRTDNWVTEQIIAPTDIKQGNSLGPMLFNIVMDEIIGQLRRRGIIYQ